MMKNSIPAINPINLTGGCTNKLNDVRGGLQLRWIANEAGSVLFVLHDFLCSAYFSIIYFFLFLTTRENLQTICFYELNVFCALMPCEKLC